MPTLYRKYGGIVEITNYEKNVNNRKKRSTKVHVLSSIEGFSCLRKRRFDSVKRAKKICLRRVSSAVAEFGSPLFITCTFSGNASDSLYASKALTRFQWRLRSKYPKCVSIFVPELSPRGRIHFHGLVFNLPLEWGDKVFAGRVVTEGSERKTRLLADLWKEGFLDCKQTDGSSKLAFYLSKYITKSGSNVLFDGIRLIRVSRGFPKDIELRGDFADYLRVKYEREKIEAYSWHGSSSWLGDIDKKVYFVDY